MTVGDSPRPRALRTHVTLETNPGRGVPDEHAGDPAGDQEVQDDGQHGCGK